MMKNISVYALPVIFILIIYVGLYKNIKVYEVFVDSAKEGIMTIFRIMPSLIGLMVAIGVFRASGALDYIIAILNPLTSCIGIPSQALPLAILRPISGSASLALVSDIIKTNGPDSYIGRVVSTMMGSTETIFYTIAVYFGAVGIKNIKYTLAAALIADLVSVLASVWICTVVFK